MVDMCRWQVVPEMLNVLGELDRELLENADVALCSKDVTVNMAKRNVGKTV